MSLLEHVIADIRAVFECAETADQVLFDADLAYLQSYGAALIEHCGHLLPDPTKKVSQLEELLNQKSHGEIAALMLIMSPAARDVMLWPVI